MQFKNVTQTNEREFGQALEVSRELNYLKNGVAELKHWQEVALLTQDSARMFFAKRRVEEVSAELVKYDKILVKKAEYAKTKTSSLLKRYLRLSELLSQMNSSTIHKNNNQLTSFNSLANIISFQVFSLQKRVVQLANESGSKRLAQVIYYLLAMILGVFILSLLYRINARKRIKAEKEVKQAWSYLNNVINSMPSMIVGIDPNTKITHINREAEIESGIPVHASIGKSLQEVFPDLSSYVSEIKKSIQHKEILSYSKKSFSKNRRLKINITIYPLVMNGIKGAVIRMDNVTRQVKVEDQLRQSQKMSAVGQLAGGISHDLKNTLTGILGAAELLKEHVDAEGEKYLELMLESGNNATNITSQLLSFSRREEIEMAKVDLSKILKTSVDLLRHSIPKSIDIKLNQNSKYPLILGEASRIQNIFLNLGINSSHAINGNGHITFTSQDVNLDKLFCESSPFDIQPGDYIQVDVEDDGCGISPENLSKIFDPFFSTKGDAGTGLGLSSVYGMVQEMKGFVRVYSEVDKGTVFSIGFPVKTFQNVAEQPIAVEPGESSGNILIIDDEEQVRASAKAILTKEGFSVKSAENGKVGLEILESEQTFDAVILDLNMPGMNGRECFQKLRLAHPDLPVIFASGFDPGQAIDPLLDQGPTTKISKPFSATKLASMVKKSISK